MFRSTIRPLPAVALLPLLLACAPGEVDPGSEAAAPEDPAPASTSGAIDVVATEFSFTAPPTFPSGWVTLRFDNQGREPHFLILWKLPAGRTFDDWTAEVTGPFSRLYKVYRAGELDQETFMAKLGEALPEWFFAAERKGGPGFTSRGRVSQTTVHLEPGDYVMECYVRSAAEGDTFHGEHGMLRPLIVTEERAAEEPPEADLEITLSNFALAIEGTPIAGEQTVRVRIEEDPKGLILHNVHLARLDADGSPEAVAQWMDWVDEMLPPAPAEFLGGAGQLPAGGESYFTVDLEPGRYAWVSETWGRDGMVHEFTIE